MGGIPELKVRNRDIKLVIETRCLKQELLLGGTRGPFSPAPPFPKDLRQTFVLSSVDCIPSHRAN